MADIEKKNVDTATDAPAKATKATKAKKDDKKSVFKRMGDWFRSCKSEMNKVVWASRETVIHNSIMVIAVIVVVAVLIGLLDIVFDQGISGLNKII